MDISVGNPMDVGAEQPARKAAGTGAVGRLILCEAFLLCLAPNSLLSEAFTLVKAYLVCNT
jgi:hypothetical protein